MATPFTEKKITPWGGMILMKKLIVKTKINELLERLPLQAQKSNRGYNPIKLINNFLVSIWSGVFAIGSYITKNGNDRILKL
jgi:hypothetical protein